MIMLIVSAIVHLVLIVSITFEIKPLNIIKSMSPTLDVVLVNAKTKSKPTKAEILAQANLNRGGNTDANRVAKTALPPPRTKTTEMQLDPNLETRSTGKQATQAETEAERQQRHVAELEKQVQNMMTQLKSMQKVDTNASQQVVTPKTEKNQQDNTTKKVGNSDLMASSLEMVHQEAVIAKEQEEYQKRPKRFVIGANTKEYLYAAYEQSYQQKIEMVGTNNFPEIAKNPAYLGRRVMLTVSIRSDGSLESIEVSRSSGVKALDDAAQNIVKMSAPFAAFPEKMRRNLDILSIVRTMIFTKEEVHAE